MLLTDLNHLDGNKAKELLMQCCTCEQWVNNMIKNRPFGDYRDLLESANIAWQGLSEKDYLQAFDGHPKIGDVNSLRDKYANTKQLASGEQSSVNHASDLVIADLSRENENYLKKFGFIFIVCATGKSAIEMLSLLQKRMLNNRDTELVNAAEEQRKIFQIRLKKMFGELK